MRGHLSRLNKQLLAAIILKNAQMFVLHSLTVENKAVHEYDSMNFHLPGAWIIALPRGVSVNIVIHSSAATALLLKCCGQQ